MRISGMGVFDLCRPPELDATLVLLAETLGQHEILTLDRRGFSVFRTRQGKPLRAVLDRRD